MTKDILLLLLIITITLAWPNEDKVSSPPGMLGANIYSGFLKTSVAGRQIHYVLIEADVDDPNNASLTIWLNGGPGCSSLIGMIQQIGPYIVGNDYKQGDQLTKNPYSWSKVSNLLFLESPAIVGFGSETNSSYEWTDQETAKDAFEAVKDFLFNKAIQMSVVPLYIAGQSYAGKYIPDLTDLILRYNSENGWTEQDLFTSNYINLKGILVGNGVMTFQEHSLQKSSIDYMIGHSMMSNRLEDIYKLACTTNFNSPRCHFFRYEFDMTKANVNPYNIYQICNVKPAEAIRLMEALSPKEAIFKDDFITRQGQLGDIPDCPSDNGAIQYWNLNKIQFKVSKYNKTWSPCTHLTYKMTQKGSMDEYRRIFFNKAIKVWMMSGDWDDVVPFTDTKKNVDILNYEKAGWWSSWNVLDQHAGFYQNYLNNFTVITVKGAGHMVPQTQPKPAYQLFYNFVNNKPVNNQVF